MSSSRVSSLALCSILLFSTLESGSISANAASKPKMLCKKIGQQATVKSLKFTCIKRKGKLTWNQGVASNQVAASSAAPTTSNPPNSGPSGDPLVISTEKALNAEIPKIDLSPIKDSEIGIVISEPGVDSRNIEITIGILRQLFAAQPIMNLPKSPVVILATTEEFIKSEFPKYCNENISWFPNEGTKMKDWNDWAFVSCITTSPVQVIPMPKGEIADIHIGDAIGSDMGYIPIGLSDNTPKIPTWFVRGLKGVAGEYMLSMGKNHWVAKNTDAGRCINVALKDVSFSYQEIDKNHCDYSLGVAVSRYMVAIKGFRSTLEFINRVQKTGIWSEKICEDFLGIPFEKFERDAKDYIRKSKM
jgi:hypothetical protein